MNLRTVKILHLLIQENKTIADLAEEFGVTERTIRNDLNLINDFLRSNNYKPLTIGDHGLIRSDLDLVQVNSLLELLNFYDYKLTNKERRELISYFLLYSVKPITIKMLMGYLFVSRSTINKDLENIKKELANADIKIVPYKNRGLIAKGKEESIRNYLQKLLDDPSFSLSLERYDEFEDAFLEGSEVFTNYERQTLEKIINEKLAFLNMTANENSFRKLRNFIEIQIKRNRTGFYLEAPTVKRTFNCLTDELYDLLVLYFKITENESEKAYLDDFIESLMIRKDNKYNDKLVDIQLLTRNFIKNISRTIDVELRDDYEFFESFSSHLNSIQKEEDSFYESNPFVDQIVLENQNILKAVKENIDEIEDFFGRRLSDIDIAYIVVHICAALERKESHKEKINTVLICNAGIGTSRLLEQRLKKHFNLKEIAIQTPQESIENVPNQLIISTVDLDRRDIDYIRVRPILTDEDYIKIGKAIETIRSGLAQPEEKKKDVEDPITQLIQNINETILDLSLSKYDQAERIDKLILQHLGYNEGRNPRLYELLTPEMIRLNAQADDWRDAVVSAGKLLLDKGLIEESYIDSCLRMIEDFGPYMLIGERILLPHSKVEPGNKDVGFSLIRFDKDILLDNGRSFRYVCFMSAVDERKHLRALFTLGNLIQNKDYLEKLDQAQTEDEVYRILRDFDYLELPISQF